MEQRSLPAADPGDHAADEPVMLGHPARQIGDRAGDQAEVPGGAGDLHVGEPGREPVERGGATGRERAPMARGAAQALGQDRLLVAAGGDDREAGPVTGHGDALRVTIAYSPRNLSW